MFSICWDVYQDGFFNFNLNKNFFDFWFVLLVFFRVVLVEVLCDMLMIVVNSCGFLWIESGFWVFWGKFWKKLEEKNKVWLKLIVYGLCYIVGNYLVDVDVFIEDIVCIFGIIIEMVKYYFDCVVWKKMVFVVVVYLDQIGKRML